MLLAAHELTNVCPGITQTLIMTLEWAKQPLRGALQVQSLQLGRAKPILCPGAAVSTVRSQA